MTAAVSAPDAIVVTIPIRTQSEANCRDHWSKKAARVSSQRFAVAFIVRPPVMKARLPLPLVVTMTRIAPRALDDDNLRGCLKAVRDSIAEVLGIDDRDPRCAWAYEQAKGKPKEYAVSIKIERKAGA